VLLLYPVSALYGLGVRIRNLLYDKGLLKTKRLPVPVISVGNLSVGGSGKTSLTMFLAQSLSEVRRVTVLLRGYRRRSKGVRVVSEWGRVLTSQEEAGDEAYMMAKLLKGVSVVVAEDRFRGGELAVRDLGADLLILDDGFQHRKLHRDLDILLIKRSDLSDRLLPAGRLREPLSSAERSHAVVLAYQETYPFEFRTSKPLFKMRRVFLGLLDAELKLKPLSWLEGREVVAFCGLGDNRQFLDSLRDLGIRVREFLSFPDHHSYRGFTLREDRIYVTTLKDMVKLPPRENLYALHYRLEVPGLVEFVRSRLHL
jgi:tetraacyldisaccharide 4'-kinase